TVLADFSKHLLETKGGIVVSTLPNKKEGLRALEKTFRAHANSDKCWDQQSLESYFQTRIPENEENPEDEANQALLKENASALWKLTTYFAQWPFNTTTPESAPTGLTYPAFIRAVAFLSGRHLSMFECEGWDAEYDFDLSNKRTDRLMVEYIFRALATSQTVTSQTEEEEPSLDPPRPGETTTSPYHRDLMDILHVVQPIYIIYRERTTRRGVQWMAPVADRLATPGRPVLSSLRVSANELLPLLDLLISLLQHASEFDKEGCVDRIDSLKKARETLESENMVPFEDFWKLFAAEDRDDTRELAIYDALALLFTTFLHPFCLKYGELVSAHWPWQVPGSFAPKPLSMDDLRDRQKTMVDTMDSVKTPRPSTGSE
ncbi:unnamed protein product, partial [Clonostachys rosea]